MANNSYSNPTSLLTPTDFKLSGMAGGYFSGQRENAAWDAIRSQQQAANLQNQMDQMKNDTYAQDAPVRAIDRTNNLNMGNMVNDNYGTGKMAEAYGATQDTGIAQSQIAQAKAKIAQAEGMSDVLNRTDQYLTKLEDDGQGGLAFNSNPDAIMGYSKLQAEAKTHGFSLPDNPFDPKSRSVISAKAAAGVNNMDTIRASKKKLDALAAQQEYISGPANATRLETARIAAAASVKKGQIAADAYGNRPQDLQKTVVEIAKKPGPLTQPEMTVLKLYSDDKVVSELKGREMVAFIMAKKNGDPLAEDSSNEREYVENVKKDQFEKLVTAISQAKETQTASPSAPTPTQPMASQGMETAPPETSPLGQALKTKLPQSTKELSQLPVTMKDIGTRVNVQGFGQFILTKEGWKPIK
jgi:hypothetical protein